MNAFASLIVFKDFFSTKLKQDLIEHQLIGHSKIILLIDYFVDLSDIIQNKFKEFNDSAAKKKKKIPNHPPVCMNKFCQYLATEKQNQTKQNGAKTYLILAMFYS